jgi:hypothetical protein
MKCHTFKSAIKINIMYDTDDYNVQSKQKLDILTLILIIYKFVTHLISNSGIVTFHTNIIKNIFITTCTSLK